MNNLDSIVSPELLSSLDSSRYKMCDGVVLGFGGFLFVVWFCFSLYILGWNLLLIPNWNS